MLTSNDDQKCVDDEKEGSVADGSGEEDSMICLSEDNTKNEDSTAFSLNSERLRDNSTSCSEHREQSL